MGAIMGGGGSDVGDEFLRGRELVVPTADFSTWPNTFLGPWPLEPGSARLLRDLA